MDDRTKEDTLSAIAVVTAALGEEGDSKRLAAQVANDWMTEGPDGAERLVTGFLNLTVLLLTQLKLRTGDSPESALQVAASIIAEWDEED